MVCAQELKTYAHTKTWYSNNHCTLIIMTKKWQQLKYPSADEWINKMSFIPYNKIVLGNKKECSILMYAIGIDESQKLYTNLNQPDTKGYILHNTIDMKLPEKAIYRNRK